MVRERNSKVLAAAVGLAKASGLRALTRDAVARTAGVSTGSVNHAFGTMECLRDEVLRVGVTERILPIVMSGLALGHPICLNASPELKRQALATLA